MIVIGIALNVIWIACAVYYGVRCERLEDEIRFLHRALKRNGMTIAVAGENIAEGDFVRMEHGAVVRARVAA